jgi:hypothetical protein
LGVRTTVPAIASHTDIAGKEIFGGFCYNFGQKLQAELRQVNPKATVIYRVIRNEYTGSRYPRWGSLLTDNPQDRQDIQCGPNSRQAIDKGLIIFSDSNFYETGIKILLKKETLDKYSIYQDSSNLPGLLETVRSKFRIGAIKETTTLDKLATGGYKKDSSDTRKEALSKLTQDEIEAFASDGIILRFLLENGDGGKPFKDMGYVIFPEGANYLAGKTEKYAIAISNSDGNSLYSKALQHATSQVLDQQEFRENERVKLEQYESGKGSTFPDNPLIRNILIGILAILAAIGIFLFLRKRSRNHTNKVHKPEFNLTINYINMSQDLAKAAPQIQELVEQLKKQGITTEIAKEQVAKDIATQAQSDPTMKDKLVKWAGSLADKTVSDVAKEIIKIAIRLTGFPLP